MKKFFLAFLLLLFIQSAHAADFRSIGLNAKVCAYTFDGNYYLILSFNDYNDYCLIVRPVIKFLLNDGTIIKLDGYDEAVKLSSTAINWGGLIAGSSKENHYAILPISNEQIEQLKIGVDKVVINTIPKVYKSDKWMNKKKFGMLLYQDFMKLPNDFNTEMENNSEDGVYGS